MYSSFEDFQREALLCGTAHYPDGSLTPGKMRVAFEIYCKACAGTTLLDADDNQVNFGVTIVGRLGNAAIVSDESFPCIDDVLKANLKTLSEQPGDVIGSILDTGDWSLLGNEAWLLGGLQAQTEFHFASPLRWSNLWSDADSRMTVTAREVLGIVAHGYQIRQPNKKLEAIAVCVDPEKASASSLLTYRGVIDDYQSAASLCAYLQPFLDKPL